MKNKKRYEPICTTRHISWNDKNTSWAHRYWFVILCVLTTLMVIFYISLIGDSLSINDINKEKKEVTHFSDESIDEEILEEYMNDMFAEENNESIFWTEA
jgi:hypothetical protein